MSVDIAQLLNELEQLYGRDLGAQWGISDLAGRAHDCIAALAIRRPPLASRSGWQLRAATQFINSTCSIPRADNRRGE